MKSAKILAILLVAIMLLAVLTACGECEHVFADGKCTSCGEPDPNYQATCIHHFTDGVCTNCGEVDPNYVPPTPVCQHNWTNGVCYECMTICKHDFENGTCKICKLVCSHRFEENSVCEICTYACRHNYIDAVCNKCGKVCIHNYENGFCTECAEEDPNAIPQDGGASLYGEIVAKFKELALYKTTYGELPPKNEQDAPYVEALRQVADLYPSKNSDNPDLEQGYAFKDINGDGWVELILLERNSYVHGLFTLVDKTPVVVRTFITGMCRITTDGMLFYIDKAWGANGTQTVNANHYDHLVGDQLVGLEYGWYDLENGTTVYYKVEEGSEIEVALTKAEYNDYANNLFLYFVEYGTRLTKLNSFKFVNAIADVSDATIGANFSSYDGIINTFALMHSHVAGGKFERSYWTGGKYDQGMIFYSDVDFDIYNRLLGACVLVQNSSSAVFGHALKDLDGDGSDELILLDNKNNLFGIFTMVDGKPVLLDTYTDLRYACMDSNGLIYVANRMVPGSPKDFEYSIYKLENGTLVNTLTIGCKCNASGTQTGWYKVENDITTSIEQATFNALYGEHFAEKATTVSTSNYAAYTLGNAGLVFVPNEEADDE